MRMMNTLALATMAAVAALAPQIANAERVCKQVCTEGFASRNASRLKAAATGAMNGARNFVKSGARIVGRVLNCACRRPFPTSGSARRASESTQTHN
jgi:hypothetical protein